MRARDEASGGGEAGSFTGSESGARINLRVAGVLYLIPTPLGNLEDITHRAVRVLREVDWVAAEDTRRTAILFQAYEIRRPVYAHHAHNEHRETPGLVRRLLRGESGALITDAGMPGDLRFDANYIYYCTATNAWVRAPLHTW